MTRDQIEKRLRTEISQQLGIAEDEVTADSTFVEDLGADSLDVVEIALITEEAFGIAEISDDDMDRMPTFGQLVAFVADLRAERAPKSA